MPTGAEFVQACQRQLGKPYVFGATGPNSFDCSGLVVFCLNQIGIKGCPRTSEEQFAWCQPVDPGKERTGDLVFIVGAEIDPSPGHVMVVVNPGNPDKVIDAPFTGSVVRYDTYSRSGTGLNQLVGYGRVPGLSTTPGKGASTVPGPSTAQSPAQMAAAAGTVVGVGFTFLILGILFVLGTFFLVKAFTGTED